MERWVVCVVLSVVLGMGVSGCGTKDQAAQRVLLITIDTVRADALGCYELPPPAAHTPHLDRLAADGTLYWRASCNIPATLTSHTAILSGRLPRSTGVRFAKDQVPKPIETLAETLNMEGFSTAAFLSSVVLNRLYGLDQGFDVYEDLSGAETVDAERSAENTTDLALEWLQTRPASEPFFLWVHYYDAHSPYQPPTEFDRYGPEGYSGWIDGSANQVSRLAASGGEGMDEADLQRLRALYLGEVEYMDHHLGRLIEAFDQHDKDGRSLIVTLADHGENLGEHGRYFHGADLFGQSMHIPFMIRWPHRQHAGSKEDELVQTIDVAPTILAACGILPPPEAEGVHLGNWFGEGVDNSRRTALQENEEEYRSDADKLFAAEHISGRLIDRRRQRRHSVLVGRSLQLELTDSCFLRAWIKGDPSVEVVAQIRYHTQESWNTKDVQRTAQLPVIMVRTSRYGLEAVHQLYPVDETLRDANPDWTAIAAPDLYERALGYGKTQGWEFDHVVLESIALDVAGIAGQTRLDVWVDEIELVGKQAKMLDHFELRSSQPYQDAGVGERMAAGSQIEAGNGLNRSKALHIAAAFEEENVWEYVEYHRFLDHKRPYDEENVLNELSPDAFPSEAVELADELDSWLNRQAGASFSVDGIDKAQEEKLRSLGYF